MPKNKNAMPDVSKNRSLLLIIPVLVIAAAAYYFSQNFFASNKQKILDGIGINKTIESIQNKDYLNTLQDIDYITQYDYERCAVS